jgi:hypothetical protein
VVADGVDPGVAGVGGVTVVPLRGESFGIPSARCHGRHIGA